MNSNPSAQLDTRTSLKTIALSRTVLFGGLSATALRKVALIAEWRVLAAGIPVIHKGDPGTHLFVIHIGRVKCGMSTIDGKEVTFSLLGPGTVFGELAFADGGPRTADAVAVESVELLALGRRELMPLLQSEPEVMLQMMSSLAARARWISENYEDAAFLDLPKRLAKRLLLLSQHFGFDTPRGRRLSASLPHRELANHMNVTRESVSRLVQKWRREGILEEHRGVITIKEVGVLKRIAASF